ncbi:MAG: ATP-dependent RNA helicase, partial [Persicimonas sp.]
MYLPVDEVRAEFDAALGADRPIVLSAPTGSGKSTRLPLWMAEQLDGPILVVEPRRVACRSLAGWLSEQRGERVGETIGYTVRFDDRTSDST